MNLEPIEDMEIIIIQFDSLFLSAGRFFFFINISGSNTSNKTPYLHSLFFLT